MRWAASHAPAAPRKGGRQEARQLGYAGLEVIDDAHHVVVPGADLAAHAREAGCAALERCDTHHIVEGHPQREEARGLAQHLARSRAMRIGRPLRRVDGAQARQIELAVARVLELDDAIMAERDMIACRGRECGGRVLRARRGADRMRRRRRAPLRVGLGHRRMAPREPAQTGFHTDTGRADDVLEHAARHGQDTARGDRAEHHRADDGAAFLRGGIHVEREQPPAIGARDLQQAIGVEAPVAQRHLLRRGERAARRRDHERAVRADIACGHDAPRFQELGCDHEIDVPRHGIQPQHRHAVLQRSPRHRMDLDVVRRCAGPLRDAGDRRALRDVAGLRRGIDDPFGEHAATLAAQRADEYRYRPARRHAGCRNPITARRTRSAARSSQRALRITSPR
jgi:hypothetical protein